MRTKSEIARSKAKRESIGKAKDEAGDKVGEDGTTTTDRERVRDFAEQLKVTYVGFVDSLEEQHETQ